MRRLRVKSTKREEGAERSSSFFPLTVSALVDQCPYWMVSDLLWSNLKEMGSHWEIFQGKPDSHQRGGHLR